MKPLHRPLARALVAAAAAFACAPSVAVVAPPTSTPNDYAMAYTTETGGITLVDSATFRHSRDLVASTTPVVEAQGYYAGVVSNHDLQQIRPHSLIYSTGGTWQLAALRRGLAPTPVQVSSETTITKKLCGSLQLNRDYSTELAASLFYQAAGADGKCNTADDVVKRIALTDGPNTAPVVTPFHSLNLDPVYDTSGVLQAVYTLQGGSVLRLAADLTTQTTLATGVASYQFVGQNADGSVVMLIDGVLRWVRSNGRLVTAPLARPTAGFKISQALVQDGTVYFVQSATDTSATIQALIDRVPADGSAQMVVMQRLRTGASINGFSTSRLVFTVGQSFFGTLLPSAIQSVGKTDDATSATVSRVYTAKQGEFPIVLLITGDNVFINDIGTDTTTGDPVSIALVRSDTGTSVVQYGKGSAFLGGQFDHTVGVLDNGGQQEQAAFGRLLLASRATDGQYLAARLSSLDPSSLSMVRLVDLPADADTPTGFGVGPGSIGQFTQGSQTEVFGFDLFNNRYRQLTVTPSVSESPVF